MTTYDDAKAALVELLKGGEAFKITPQLLRDSLIALAEGQRLVEEDAGTANQVLSTHISASDPHPQYTTPTEVDAQVTTAINALRAQLMGGNVSAALDTFLEIAARFDADESTLTTLTNQIAAKQPAATALTEIAALARAKGALIVGGAGAWSLLNPSINGYILTQDDTQPGGMKWAAAGGSTLPVATASVLGGVKQGTNLSIDAGGVVSLNIPNVTFNSGGVTGLFAASVATDVPLVAKGAAGQTAHVQDWLDSTNSVIAYVAADGAASFGRKLGVGTLSSPNAWLEIADPLGNAPTLQFSYSGAPTTYNNIWTATGWGASTQTLTLTMKCGASVTTPIKVYQNGTTELGGPLKFADGTSQSTAAGARVTSSQLSITASTTLTFAHGLGAVPTRFGAYAVCLTAQGPFAVGDRIPFTGADNGYTVCPTLYGNATSIKFDVSAALYAGAGFINLAGNANFAIVLWAEK